MPGADKRAYRDGKLDGSGRRESSRSSHRGHVAAWISAIAGMIAAIFTALAFIYGDVDKTQGSDPPPGVSPERRTAESSRTAVTSVQRASESYSQEETRLGRRITPTSPVDKNLNCQPAPEGEEVSGGLATLVCSPRGVQFPIKAIATSFANEDNLNAFMESEASLVDSTTIGEEIAKGFPCPRDDTWLNTEGIRIGRLICYSEGDVYSIVWAFENDAYVDKYRGERFAVKAWSVDHQALAEWWQTTPV